MIKAIGFIMFLDVWGQIELRKPFVFVKFVIVVEQKKMINRICFSFFFVFGCQELSKTVSFMFSVDWGQFANNKWFCWVFFLLFGGQQ